MDCSYIFISSLSILCLGFGGCRLILSKILMLQNLMAYVQNISGKSLMHQKDDQLSKNCNSFYMIHLQHKRYSRKYFPQEEYVFAVRLL